MITADSLTSRHLSGKLLALALATMIGACSDSATDPGTGGSGAAPKVGSTYSFELKTMDSNGAVLASSIADMTVESNSASYAGRNNLTTFKAAGTLSYMDYLSNGDFSSMYYMMLNGKKTDSSWINVGVGSKTNTTLPDWDRNDGVLRMVHSGSITYVTPETITLAGESMSTIRYIFASEIKMGIPMVGTFVSTMTASDTTWYSPKLGTVVKQSMLQINSNQVSSVKTYKTMELKSYTLK